MSKKVKRKSTKFLSFKEFLKKLKRKKQTIVNYPDKLDPKYIPVKDLFKKTKK